MYTIIKHCHGHFVLLQTVVPMIILQLYLYIQVTDSLYFGKVDEGLIIYEHTHNEAVGWSAEDSFTFTVSSPPAALDLQVFHVAISYEINRHDQSSRLLANTGEVTVLFETPNVYYHMWDPMSKLEKLQGKPFLNNNL